MIKHFESRSSKDKINNKIDIFMDVDVPEDDLEKLMSFLRNSKLITNFNAFDGSESAKTGIIIIHLYNFTNYRIIKIKR